MPEEDYAEDPWGLSFSGIFHTYGYKENLTLPRNPALTPAQADEPCNGHTSESLLKVLNTLTGYHLNMSEPNLEAGLGILINGDHDIGRAYAWFRTAFAFTAPTKYSLATGWPWPVKWVAWYSGLPDISNCDSSLTSVNQPGVDAVDKRETAIQDIDGEHIIINPDLYHPRRLWDILANRVIPYEWHARTTRMFKLNIETEYIGKIRHIRNPDYYFNDRSDSRLPHTKFNAEYAERLAKWHQTAFEDCVPFAAISHSWAADLEYIISPVNNKMWPIPLPADVTLEAVRQSLLNLDLPQSSLQKGNFWELHAPPHGVEYCWLDILCLRQAWANKSGELLTKPAHSLWKQLEKTRLEEWAIDVPTIGSIYQRSTDILLYLNGIGRPFSLVQEDWESPYHWIKRAWTLQEFPRQGPYSDKKGIVMCVMDKPRDWLGRRYSPSIHKFEFSLPFRTLRNCLPDLDVKTGSCILRLINTIARRHASNEVDKIAGLLFLISRGGALSHFPIYKPGEDIESAWLRLVNTLNNCWRWSLSFYCPQFPDQIFPTWRSLCEVLLNTPQPESFWEDTRKFFLRAPGSFPISSSAPLNADPLVGMQPLPCRLLTAIDEQGQVLRKLQILPDIASGIEQEYVVVQQWYLSDRVRPGSGEIYYLIPVMPPFLDPSELLLWAEPPLPEERCSDWIVPFFEQPAYFLVCEPLLDENSDKDNWDGIAFKKLGFTWIQAIGPPGDKNYWNDGLERDLPFWRFFDSVHTADMIPLMKDIARATPKAAKEKYGKEKVYSLIY